MPPPKTHDRARFKNEVTKLLNQFICVPITETNPDAFLAAAREAAQSADVVELRLDYLPADDCQTVLERLPAFAAEVAGINLLLTYRPREQDRKSVV